MNSSSTCRPYRAHLVTTVYRLRLQKSLKKRKVNHRSWKIALATIVSGYGVFQGIHHINDWIERRNEPAKKEKVVVVGSGWASQAFLSVINPYKYDVTVISPRNYFLFTPLLSYVANGVMRPESLVSSIRDSVKSRKLTFLRGFVTDVDRENNRVIYSVDAARDGGLFVEYDKLVLALGDELKGVPGGGPNVLPFKSLSDALRVRDEVSDRLERASLPIYDEASKKKILQFVIVGNNAVVLDLARELERHLLGATRSRYRGLRDLFSIRVFHCKDLVHNYYDHAILNVVKSSIRNPEISLMPIASVDRVENDQIHYTPSKGYECESQTFGLCIWCLGSKQNSLVENLKNSLDQRVQDNKIALVCDSQCKVAGTSNIFAIGDCATIKQEFLVKRFKQVMEEADLNKDGFIDLHEYLRMVEKMSKIYPGLKSFNKSAFDLVDVNHDQILTETEFEELMRIMDQSLTRFPRTATVAQQQGQFLAKLFNSNPIPTQSNANPPQFKYKHIGGYEYIGAENGIIPRGSKGDKIISGLGANWLWTVAYFTRFVPLKIRFNTACDWLSNKLFGCNDSSHVISE